jgi:ubiquinone biosynthesis protein
MTRHVRLEQARTELASRGVLDPARRERIGTPDRLGFGERLGQALPAVGPLFALFGSYLAGRTDVLPVRDCRALACLPGEVPATPAPRVGSLLARRHGDAGAPADRLVAFAEHGRWNLLHQWHDGRLDDGTSVTIKIVRPEAREMVERELGLLPVLEELALDAGDTSSVVEDFVIWLDRQLDLELELTGLDRLAAEVEDFDAFEVPEVLRELSDRDLAVTVRADGPPLVTVVGSPGDRRPRLARRLCQSWLQQSLLEGTCVEGPLADNLRLLTGDRFGVTGGIVTVLGDGRRRRLLNAVVGVARHDPDRAGEALLGELFELDSAADRDRVRAELRQAESFRSGGWTDDFAGRRLADDLLVCWRRLGELGYAARGPTVSFIRGFSELDAAARALAPDVDAMAAAIDDVRLVAAAVSIREQLGPSAMIRAAEELIPTIEGLFDEPDSGGRAPDGRDRRSDRGHDRRRAASWWSFGGSLAVLAAATILGVSAIRAHPDQAWIEPSVAIVLGALALGIFRLVRGAPPKGRM